MLAYDYPFWRVDARCQKSNLGVLLLPCRFANCDHRQHSSFALCAHLGCFSQTRSLQWSSSDLWILGQSTLSMCRKPRQVQPRDVISSISCAKLPHRSSDTSSGDSIRRLDQLSLELPLDLKWLIIGQTLDCYFWSPLIVSDSQWQNGWRRALDLAQQPCDAVTLVAGATIYISKATYNSRDYIALSSKDFRFGALKVDLQTAVTEIWLRSDEHGIASIEFDMCTEPQDQR